MSDADDLEDLRERKRQELIESVEGGTGNAKSSPGREDQATTNEPATPGEPIHVDGRENLQETVDRYPVVLLEFYADWCGPCKQLEPVLESLAETTDAAIAKVDVDANQELAAEYQVRGVPAMVLFADGEAVEQLTGARDQHTLERLIGQYAA
ncbi:MAG: thioredoxin family protein [Halobacteriales archaeon]